MATLLALLNGASLATANLAGNTLTCLSFIQVPFTVYYTETSWFYISILLIVHDPKVLWISSTTCMQIANGGTTSRFTNDCCQQTADNFAGPAHAHAHAWVASMTALINETCQNWCRRKLFHVKDRRKVLKINYLNALVSKHSCNKGHSKWCGHQPFQCDDVHHEILKGNKDNIPFL